MYSEHIVHFEILSTVGPFLCLAKASLLLLSAGIPGNVLVYFKRFSSVVGSNSSTGLSEKDRAVGKATTTFGSSDIASEWSQIYHAFILGQLKYVWVNRLIFR